MQESILGTDKISTLFLKYSIPSIAGMLFLGLNTIVDGFFVGHYIGVSALASVNIAMPFFSLMLAIGVVIGLGTQSFIGRKLGEGNIRAAHDTFKTSLSLILGISLFLVVLAIVFTKEIAAFLGATEQLMPFVITYIRYESVFLPFFGIMLVLDYVLKVMGKPIYSMQVLVVAVISHMILNYIMIVRLGLGIKGAALATGFAYCIGFILVILPFLARKTSLKLFRGNSSRSLAYNIVYNGSAEGITEISTGITTFLFNITLMRYVGEIGVAAFTAISYLAFVGNNILLGLADGVGPIISYNYGKGSIERVKKTLILVAISGIFIGIVMFVLISYFSRDIITVFLDIKNEEIINFAVYGAGLYAFAFLLNGLNIIASGYFTAICFPRYAALIALSKGIVWVGIGIAVLPRLYGIQGIWLTVPIAEALTFILSIVLVRTHFKYRMG